MVIMGTAWLTVSTLTLFSKRFTMSKYCHCMSGDSCANLDAWALAKSAAVRPREVFWRGSAPAPRRIPGCLRNNSRKRENLSSYVELPTISAILQKKIAHGKVERLAMFHQGLSLASFVCDFLGDLDENETSHYSNFWRSMGESKPLNGSSRVARCRNCRGMQPHVKDTWFPWDSARMWSCCSSLQMFQRLWSHEPQGSLACVPAVNCRNPLERKIWGENQLIW